MKTKTIVLVAVTLLVVVAAWKVSEQKAPQTEVTRALLYPALLERVNDIARVELRSRAHHTVLARDGERWVVQNKDGFAANPVSVRRALLQLAGLRLVEEKTRAAERFARLGVADLDSADADGTEVRVQGAGDELLVALIVGHARSSGGTARHYVRRVGEQQSWLVEGELTVGADPIPWLDAAIVDIDTARVREVHIAVPEQKAVVIRKAERADNFFTLVDVPDGYKAKSKATVSSLGAVLLDLRFNDVASARKVAGQTPARSTTVRTFDGLVVTLRDYALDDTTYTAFEFAYDEAGVVPDSAVAGDTDAASAAAGGAAGAGDDDAAAQQAETAPAETVAAEAARLAARTADWIYVLPDYKRRMLERDFDSLITAADADDDSAAR